MVYVFMLVFTLFGITNLIKGRNIKLRPGINKMDIVSMVFIWVLFAFFGYFLKSDIKDTIIMAIVASFYILTSRYARGFTENGVLVQAGSPFMTRELELSSVKQVNVKDDGDFVMFSIVTKSNAVDIQRYDKKMKDKIIKKIKDNNILLIYK